MVECDYPHGDSSWPHARELILGQVAHLDPDEQEKVLAGNARRVFGLERSMGEILGLGLTHFPPLGWPDETMDRALQFAFADPSVPDAVKAGEGWPAGMREEFDRDRLDGGGGAPGRARARAATTSAPRSTSSRRTSW